MKFQTNSSEWIGEVGSYLSDSTQKIGPLKQTLRAVDFSKLSYEDKVRLAMMFDPRAEITGELFKRQLDLYFSLLESKKSSISIPVFSEYIEWVYSQDPSKIPDKMFDAMVLRLAKSKAEELPETVTSFMLNLPQEYARDIDKMSNARINTLISVLKELENAYDDLPEECRGFIKRMFIACSVKTEISDKNKGEIRHLFKDDPNTYYSWFNKAFAGYESFETWIDEPAKKITVKNMINYANMQEKLLETRRTYLMFSKFKEIASSLGLRRLPEYDPSSVGFTAEYLREPREYKDYAKKMADIFVQMVQSEALSAAQKASNGTLTNADMFALASTQKMGKIIASLREFKSPKELGMRYAKFLIDAIHLDHLTGQRSRDIFNESHVASVQQPVVEEYEQISLLEAQINPSTIDRSDDLVKSLTAELSDLYERYDELCLQGKKDPNLEQRLLEVEDMLRELTESDSQPGSN